MVNDRKKLYRELENTIGRTPLYEIRKIRIPNGNTVFAKLEHMNPGGSHYDRVFLALYQYFEQAGRIIPGQTPLVETTSGSAGVSFARIGRILGYDCLVVCPEDLPRPRLDAIAREGAELRLTPSSSYVDGAARELAKIFRKENKSRAAQGKQPYFGFNHTQGKAAEISADSMIPVIDEAVAQAKNIYGIEFDLVVAVGGNGTTLLGFGRGARNYNLPLVMWEPLSSGLYYSKLFGEEKLRQEYGDLPKSKKIVLGGFMEKHLIPYLTLKPHLKNS